MPKPALPQVRHLRKNCKFFQGESNFPSPQCSPLVRGTPLGGGIKGGGPSQIHHQIISERSKKQRIKTYSLFKA